MSDIEKARQPNYLAVFGGLILFTIAEVGAVYLGWPRLALAIFLISTALAKALLVALYFMHLRFESRWVWVFPIIAILVGLVFIVALFPDIVLHRVAIFR